MGTAITAVQLGTATAARDAKTKKFLVRADNGKGEILSPAFDSMILANGWLTAQRATAATPAAIVPAEVPATPAPAATAPAPATVPAEEVPAIVGLAEQQAEIAALTATPAPAASAAQSNSGGVTPAASIAPAIDPVVLFDGDYLSPAERALYRVTGRAYASVYQKEKAALAPGQELSPEAIAARDTYSPIHNAAGKRKAAAAAAGLLTQSSRVPRASATPAASATAATPAASRASRQPAPIVNTDRPLASLPARLASIGASLDTIDRDLALSMIGQSIGDVVATIGERHAAESTHDRPFALARAIRDYDPISPITDFLCDVFAIDRQPRDGNPARYATIVPIDPAIVFSPYACHDLSSDEVREVRASLDYAASRARMDRADKAVPGIVALAAGKSADDIGLAIAALLELQRAMAQPTAAQQPGATPIAPADGPSSASAPTTGEMARTDAGALIPNGGDVAPIAPMIVNAPADTAPAA